MWEKLSILSLRNRYVSIIILVIFTAFFFYQAKKVQMTYDNPKIIPDQDADYLAYQNFKETFGDDGSVMLVGIETDKINELTFFQEWYDITKKLDTTSGIKSVISIANVPRLNIKKETVIFDTDTFQKEVFASSPIFKNKPKTQVELDSLFNTLKNLQFYKNLLYKDSSSFTAIAISLENTILDTKERIPFVNNLRKQFEEIGDKHDITLHYSGLPYIRTIMSDKIKSEIILFTLISFLITSLIMYFFFRSLKTIFFCNLVVLTAIIWTVGILVLLGQKVTLLTALLPPLIVVIGIANCIYLLNKYHDEFKNHQQKIKALSRVIAMTGKSLFYTNMTTAIGFGVFALTGSTILKEFGTTSFLAIMSTYFISIVLIPVIFSYLKPPKTKHTKHLDSTIVQSFLNKIWAIINNKRKTVYAITTAILIFAIIGTIRLEAIGYMLDDISKRDKMYQDLKFFEKNINGVMPFEIVIDTKKQGGAKNPSILLKIDQLEREVGKYEEFSEAISLARLVKFARQSYHNEDARFFRIPGSLELSNLATLIPQGKQNNLNSLVDSNYQKARISFQMKDVGSKEIKRIRDSVQLISQEIFKDQDVSIKLTGTSLVFLKGNDYLIKNLITSIGIAFLIIALLMAILFKSGRMILIAMVSNMIPLFITAGFMFYLGVNLKPSTVLVFSVAFGISVDFSIHFLSKYLVGLKNTGNIIKSTKMALNEVGVSMIYTSFILFFGFIIFTFSSFGGTIALGAFTSITLIVALFCNLILLPALLLSYDKSKTKKIEKTKPNAKLL